MTRITLDAPLRRRLLDLSQPLELCDETGRVLAWLTPIPSRDEGSYAEPTLSEQELRRREQEPECTTAELLTRLGKL